VCTCVFLLHQESLDMILTINPSYQTGVSQLASVRVILGQASSSVFLGANLGLLLSQQPFPSIASHQLTQFICIARINITLKQREIKSKKRKKRLTMNHWGTSCPRRCQVCSWRWCLRGISSSNTNDELTNVTTCDDR
jgi:hypothetical protein